VNFHDNGKDVLSDAAQSLIGRTQHIKHLFESKVKWRRRFYPDAPPRPIGQGLRACSGGDANPSTPKSTGLKAGDKLVALNYAFTVF
jgi:hypothetical protein